MLAAGMVQPVAGSGTGNSTVTAGAGLTATAGILAVGAGTGITVAADSVAVDLTAALVWTAVHQFTVGVIFGAGELSASLTGASMRGPNAAGTNIAAVATTFNPSRGTGTGAAGNVAFGCVVNQQASGSTLHSTGTALWSGRTNDTGSSLTGALLTINPAANCTFTNRTTAESGTLAADYGIVQRAATHGASNATVTVTSLYSHWIAGTPLPGTNVTITNPVAFGLGGAQTIARHAAGFAYRLIQTEAATLTFSAAANITTASGGVAAASFGILTLTCASAMTVDRAATVYIAGAPAAAGSVTLTAPYSLWIDAGLPRIDSVSANDTTACVLTADSGPVGANTAVQEWLTININGTTRYIPCW